MARKVGLTFTGNTVNLEASLSKVLVKLKEINKYVQQINKTQIKPKVNSKGIQDLGVRAIKTGKALDGLKKKTASYSTETTKATTSTLALTASMLAVMALRSSVGVYSDLSKEVHTLGTVAQLTSGEIKSLQGQLVKIADITSAKALSQAIEELVRTGRGLEESMIIVSSVSKLAIANGEELENTSKIIQKVMTAFTMSAKQTDEILNILHSTSLNTATDLAQLGTAFKQSAASLAVFAQMSGRYGKDLDNYKIELLKFGAASIGMFQNMGRSASQAGIHLRMLATKLVKFTNSSKAVFDKRLFDKAVYYSTETNKIVSEVGINTMRLTSDAISQIAQKDLPTAVKLMSKLYKDGIFTLEDILTGFTMRHGSMIAMLLGQMGNGYEELVDKITSGRSYLDDYEKNAKSLSNQIKSLKNSFVELGSAMGLENLIGDAVSLTKSLADGLNGTGSEMANLTVSAMKTGLQFGIILKIVKSVGGAVIALKGVLAGVALTVGALYTAIALVGVGIYKWVDANNKFNEELYNTTQEMLIMAVRTEQAKNEMELLKMQTVASSDLLKEMGQIDITKPFKNGLIFADMFLKRAEESYNVLSLIQGFDLEGIETKKNSISTNLDNPNLLIETKKAKSDKWQEIGIAEMEYLRLADIYLKGGHVNDTKGAARKQMDAEKSLTYLRKLKGEYATIDKELAENMKGMFESLAQTMQEEQTLQKGIATATSYQLEGMKIQSLETIPAKSKEEFVKRLADELDKNSEDYKLFVKAIDTLNEGTGRKTDWSKTGEILDAASELVTIEKALVKARKNLDTYSGFERKEGDLKGNVEYYEKIVSDLERTQELYTGIIAVDGKSLAIKEKKAGVQSSSNKSTREEIEYNLKIVSLLDSSIALNKALEVMNLEGLDRIKTEYKYSNLILENKEKENTLLLKNKSAQYNLTTDKGSLLSEKSRLEGLNIANGKISKEEKKNYENIVDLLKIIYKLESNRLSKKVANAKLNRDSVNYNLQLLSLKNDQVQAGLLLDMEASGMNVNSLQVLEKKRIELELLLEEFDTNHGINLELDEQTERLKIINALKRNGLDITNAESEKMGDLAGKLSGLGGQLSGMGLGTAGSVFSGIGSGMGSYETFKGGKELGGMAGGLDMATGGMGIIGAGMGILGSLFASKPKDYTEHNEEQKSLYDDNTSALQDLTNKMGELQGGVRGLSSSLITAFSRMPTFEKVTGGQDIVGMMLDRLMDTREFGSASWMEKITHSGSKGFLGIGSKPESVEYQTHTQNAESLYRQLVGRGGITNASLDQLQLFSDKLEKLNRGTSDNYDDMSKLVQAYVNGVKEMQRVTRDFQMAVNLQSMEGIEYLNKEDFLKQYTDLYESIGVVITDSITAEIEEMWRKSPSMVTITQDMRGEFLNLFTEGGTTLGKAFSDTLGTYLNAFTKNLSMVMFDSTFGKQIETLEKSFLGVMKEISELKMTGEQVTTDMLNDVIEKPIDDLFLVMSQVRREEQVFDEVMDGIINKALETGYTLSDLISNGLIKGTTKEIYDALLGGISDDGDAIEQVVNSISEKVIDSFAKARIDELLAREIMELSADLDLSLASNDIDSLGMLSQKALELGLKADAEKQRLDAIKDMFNFDSSQEYTSENQNITYATGTTSAVTNNYYLTSKAEVGVVVTDTNSLEELTERMLDQIVEKLKVKKGIDLESI